MVILSNQKYGEWEEWDVQSQSNPNTIYLVTMDTEENTIQCDCPDFKYRKENLRFGGVKISDIDNHCKHIRECLNEKGGNSLSKTTYPDKGAIIADRI